MTEKRFKVEVYDENAINGFAVLDLYKPNISKRLKYENVYVGSKEGCEIVCKFGNGLADGNEQLKQFPVKLENRIQKLQEDLQKLTEMDKSDLNPQAIEDVATVISISLNALMEFQKELME